MTRSQRAAVAAAPPDAAAIGRHFMTASAPQAAQLHRLRVEGRDHLLQVDGSRLFQIDAEVSRRLAEAMATGAVEPLLAALGLDAPPQIDDRPLSEPPLHALSLAVSQSCNLGCGYCYAGQGGFGRAPQQMPLERALAAVDMLLSGVPDQGRCNLAFMGGEPLANRAVITAATRHAAALAAPRGVQVAYSITTNGTLVTQADGDFFEEHGFAVTISLDGPAEHHDRQRPFKNGQGSFDRIMRNVRPLLNQQRRMQVSARVTVTPDSVASDDGSPDGLRRMLDGFIADGFHSVGFSPLLRSSSGQGEMTPEALATMLGAMIACGQAFEAHALAGRRYPFANLLNALREIHRGTHRPYPCGAGAGYLGVSAEGDLSACHRFVGDEAGAMGSLDGGIDRDRQAQWLGDRHVHRQSPCNSCWARYMCGGGCHHEVIGGGRPACDYVRGWLHYCLGAYLRLSDRCPDLFDSASAPLPETGLAGGGPVE
jgi:uncharacterized protein